MKQRGFTLIEAAVVICIIMILAAVAVPVFNGKMSTEGITYGVHGVTESRCIEGYKFVIGSDGNARQILDEFGKGVRCGDQVSNGVQGKPF